jgi:hypothetical protein
VLKNLAVRSSFQNVLSVVFYAEVEKKSLIIINIPWVNLAMNEKTH